MEDELKQGVEAALMRQWGVGRDAVEVLSNPSEHWQPRRVLIHFVDELWKSAGQGRLDSEAARFHFALVAWLAAQGLNWQNSAPVDVQDEIPDVLHKLEELDESGWIDGVRHTGLLGLVVHLVHVGHELDALGGWERVPKSDTAKQKWLEALSCAAAAELIYAGNL